MEIVAKIVAKAVMKVAKTAAQLKEFLISLTLDCKMQKSLCMF
jgi:hypothetical protein